jgi:hypothetical protein
LPADDKPALEIPTRGIKIAEKSATEEPASDQADFAGAYQDLLEILQNPAQLQNVSSLDEFYRLSQTLMLFMQQSGPNGTSENTHGTGNIPSSSTHTEIDPYELLKMIEQFNPSVFKGLQEKYASSGADEYHNQQ